MSRAEAEVHSGCNPLAPLERPFAVRLGDVAEIVMGQSPPGDAVNPDAGVPLLNGPTEFGEHNPIPLQYTTEPKRIAEAGDILFCVRGSTTGRMNWADQEYAIGRGIAAIRHSTNASLQPFVRAVIETRLPTLLKQATGSTFPNVSRHHLTHIPYPPLHLDEQRKVAEVLGALNARIELNRRMCETLEEMAQALYKAWFVDFEPVRAKMAGRWREGQSLSGLPAEIFHVFPNVLVDSQLGPIPDKWQIGQLGDAIGLEYGKALKASDRKFGSVPVYGSNGQIGWHDESIVEGPGIVIGRKGNPGSVCRSHADFFPIDTTFYAVIRDAGLTFEFLYYLLKWQRLSSVTSDSAVPGLNRNLAYASVFSRPTDEAIAAFSEVVKSLWSSEKQMEASSGNLRESRDALLPKLISGEIRIGASEEVAEAVGC